MNTLAAPPAIAAPSDAVPLSDRLNALADALLPAAAALLITVLLFSARRGAGRFRPAGGVEPDRAGRLRRRLRLAEHAATRRALDAHRPGGGAAGAGRARHHRCRRRVGAGRAGGGGVGQCVGARVDAGADRLAADGAGRRGDRRFLDRHRRLAAREARGQRDHRQPADVLHRHRAVQPVRGNRAARSGQLEQAIDQAAARRLHAAVDAGAGRALGPGRGHRRRAARLGRGQAHAARSGACVWPAATRARRSASGCRWPG